VKILVTGGLGVIGSKFVSVCADSGDDITVIDAAETARNLWTADQLRTKYGPQITIITQRVENTPFEKLLKEHNLVLHAAAHTGIPQSAADPTDDWISNVETSRHILEAMRKTQTTTPVIMLSSVKAYRLDDLRCEPSGTHTCWPDRPEGVDESFPSEPDEPHAVSKMAQFGLVMAYGRSYDLPVTALRCSNMYGDALCHGPRHGWLVWFCILACFNKPISLQGTGIQTRDMLFASDVAKAILAAHQNMDRLKGQAYNIGGGSANQISCFEATQLIGEILGKPVEIIYKPARKNDDMLFSTDHRKFTSITGWKPTVSVREGVKQVLDFIQANRETVARIYAEYL
jgi:CDP-paratose 2-epimerase